jgi:hypothetical protein
MAAPACESIELGTTAACDSPLSAAWLQIQTLSSPQTRCSSMLAFVRPPTASREPPRSVPSAGLFPQAITRRFGRVLDTDAMLHPPSVAA